MRRRLRSHCGQPVNFNAAKSKMLGPALLHRMEKARLLSRAGINRDHLASFPEVATRAGEREVQQRRGTAFALWDCLRIVGLYVRCETWPPVGFRA
jgi:hypothetical protein